jgi:hypothetical protein
VPRVAIFREKNISRNTEQTEILIHSVEIPSVSWNENRSEFRSEPFLKKANHSELRNFVPNHSVEDKMVGTHIQRQEALHNGLPRVGGRWGQTPSPPLLFVVVMLAVPSNLFFSRNYFRSVPFRTSEWAIPRHTEFREISTFSPE